MPTGAYFNPQTPLHTVAKAIDRALFQAVFSRLVQIDIGMLAGLLVFLIWIRSTLPRDLSGNSARV